MIVIKKVRNIPNTFMINGQDRDGEKGGTPYVDCNKIVGDVRGLCHGVLIGSATSGTIAVLRCKLRGSNGEKILHLNLGKEHYFDLDYIYENGAVGTATDVTLLFA